VIGTLPRLQELAQFEALITLQHLRTIVIRDLQHLVDRNMQAQLKKLLKMSPKAHIISFASQVTPEAKKFFKNQVSEFITINKL
jgi:hypothetical protein